MSDKNEILKSFFKTIKEAQKRGDDSLLDISKIMNTEQFKHFKELERIVHRLFNAETLFEGLRTTIEDKTLSEQQQVSVLAIMKIFETFVSGMSKAQDKVKEEANELFTSSLDEDGGSDGMYI